MSKRFRQTYLEESLDFNCKEEVLKHFKFSSIQELDAKILMTYKSIESIDGREILSFEWNYKDMSLFDLLNKYFIEIMSSELSEFEFVISDFTLFSWTFSSNQDKSSFIFHKSKLKRFIDILQRNLNLVPKSKNKVLYPRIILFKTYKHWILP